ncbi:tannase/feruloyl esterase family alpha/beta hydrolase [Sphingomonas sp. ABOLE]|uniref:tannase/feruloyl esterase family alpha/beta hydrolase n=1 Tax=Sphingomonas sp. ABOLE TaxID=1985878 RepID=UPI000F7DF5C3|nr:tannase/feruloyl esterase family alpha/beta hydrolase [Sphingomonas sp. ABOLE]RSV38818.1 tannase/feruloyl esterase family alpha/beta hydrolase [Sphingomonas sp. ABOLE]
MSFASLALALATPAAPEAACAALARQIPDTRTEWAEARLLSGRHLPAHCRVIGTLRPVQGSRIGYELWLPRSWSGRLQMLGNGGYASALPEAAMAEGLARGSAVVATDTGHEGDDPDFARGRRQAIVDWGWRAVHETALAAKQLVARFYGRAAAHSYFNGCSTGGHQAMIEAQRFPRDFDGIVAGAPGSNRVRLNAAFLWQYLSNHRAGDDRAPILDRQDLKLLAAQSFALCRGANGKAAGGLPGDRWLNDPLQCRPDPAALLCRPGQTGGCLSAEKVAAVAKMRAGVSDARGAQVTFPWLPGSEAGWSAYWADPRQPSQPMRVNFWRVWAFDDPAWNWWRFSYARDLPAAMRRLSPVIDATDADLRAYRARGGRLLVYHGLADPVVSPLDTLTYRRAMLARTGAAADWYRLFLVPGMGHCGGGDGPNRFDAQAAIERWVEQGQAPARLTGTLADGTTRPICAYPARALHRSGDGTKESDFICAAPPPPRIRR